MKRFLAVLLVLLLVTVNASAVTLPRKIIVPRYADDPGMEEILADAESYEPTNRAEIDYTIKYDDFELRLDYNTALKKLEDIWVYWYADKNDMRHTNNVHLSYTKDGIFDDLWSEYETSEDGKITKAKEKIYTELNSHEISLEIRTREKTEAYYFNAANERDSVYIDIKSDFRTMKAKSGVKYTLVNDKITEETPIDTIPIEYPLFGVQIAGNLDVLAGTYEIPDEYPAVTSKGGVKVYKEASTRSGELVTLRQGREVTVCGEEGDFYQVRVDLGNKVHEGYVLKDCLKDQ